MTTKDLAYFLEVCRQGSINAAARELYITTQGLSKILQKLEVELGYPILVRTQTGVTLTDDGKILERHARKILQQMEGLNFEIAQRHKSHTGRLRIAASYGLLGLLSPACIVAFRKKYPDIQVDFSEYTDQRAVEAVWYHEVDVALTYLPVDMVNIVVHGHDPSLSEMIVFYANDPEMIALAKEQGAKGINICGVCCTANEVAMRHGIPMVGNFLQQENVVLTGACEAIVVDVQCIFPALGPLSKCFHTKFITTSDIARMPDSEFIHFSPENAGENAKAIVKMAVENLKNRDPQRVFIPDLKVDATVGFSVEAIRKCLDTVTNSHVDELGTMKPLVECITSGVLRGAAAMVGCNNPKVRPDHAHIELMKKLLANDVIVIVSGCSAQAAARAGLMSKEAKNLCGAGLKRVCELVGIPPVLHMGSCVDISRMMVLASEIAKDAGVNISQLPLVGCAPEWMSEKAVSIGNYVVATGIDTFLGVDPYVKGSSEISDWLQNGIRDWVEASYTVELDIEKLGDKMIERIEEKRRLLGI